MGKICLNPIHQTSAQPSCLQAKLKPFSSNGPSAKLCLLLRKYIEVEFLEISSITHLSNITSDSCGLAFCLTCKTSLKKEVSTADSSVSYLRLCMVCKQRSSLGLVFRPSALQNKTSFQMAHAIHILLYFIYFAIPMYYQINYIPCLLKTDISLL